jgi:hypothetical protein
VALHPVNYTDDAVAEIIDLIPDPALQDQFFDWLDERLAQFPRRGSQAPMPPGQRPAYLTRGHGMTVVYEVSDVDPELTPDQMEDGEPKDDAPGAPVNVIAVRPSRGQDMNRMIANLRDL